MYVIEHPVYTKENKEEQHNTQAKGEKQETPKTRRKACRKVPCDGRDADRAGGRRSRVATFWVFREKVKIIKRDHKAAFGCSITCPIGWGWVAAVAGAGSHT